MSKSKDLANLGGGFIQSGAGAVQRAVEAKLNDTVSVKDFGAIGNGTTDNTNSLNSALSYARSTGQSLYWPPGAYRITGNLSNFLDVNNAGGLAQIRRDTRIFWVGEDRFVKNRSNVIFVSPSGPESNDGLSDVFPTTLKKAWDFLKVQSWIQPQAKWKIQLLPGTYTAWTSNRTETFGPCAYHVEIVGSTDDQGVPNVIFDATNNNLTIFSGINNVTIGAHTSVNFLFKDIKVQNFASATPINIWYNANVFFVNMHANLCGGTAFQVRNGIGDAKEGKISNCFIGYDFQNVYGEVGSSAGLENRGIEFENITGNAISITRGSMCYVRQCAFTNVNIGIFAQHYGRVRTIANQFNSWTEAAIVQHTGGLWNTNPAVNENERNTYAGSENNKETIQQWSGALHDYARGNNLQGNHTFSGPRISLEGTALYQLNNPLFGGRSDCFPFRVPSFWLYSPRAFGKVRMEVFVPASMNLNLKLTGINVPQNPVTQPGSNQVIGQITLDDAQDHTWLVEFEVRGPIIGTNSIRCISRAEALGSSVTRTSFTNSALTSTTGISSSSDEQRTYRLYAQGATPGLTAHFNWLQSFVAF